MRVLVGIFGDAFQILLFQQVADIGHRLDVARTLLLAERLLFDHWQLDVGLLLGGWLFVNDQVTV